MIWTVHRRRDASGAGGRKEGGFDADLSDRDTWPPRSGGTGRRGCVPTHPPGRRSSSSPPSFPAVAPSPAGAGGLLRRRRARSLGRSGWSLQTVATSRSTEYLFRHRDRNLSGDTGGHRRQRECGHSPRKGTDDTACSRCHGGKTGGEKTYVWGSPGRSGWFVPNPGVRAQPDHLSLDAIRILPRPGGIFAESI